MSLGERIINAIEARAGIESGKVHQRDAHVGNELMYNVPVTTCSLVDMRVRGLPQ